MSNLQDITSLSDLLTTSPSQPAAEPRALRLDLARQVVQDEEPQIEIQQEEKQAQEEQQQDHTDEELQDQSQELQTLLDKQSTKLLFNTRRNELLKQRTELKQEVEDLRIQYKQKNVEQQRQLAQTKLDELLKENEDQSKAPTLTHSDENNILHQLHVLPSNDWNQRLVLIKRFYPYIEVEKSTTRNQYRDGQMVRVLEFVLVSPLLFKVPLQLFIETKTESIIDITIDNHSLTTVSILSPSFFQVLNNNYWPRKKINLIMYGLNSLSVVTHKRISAIYKLIRKYGRFLVNQTHFSPLLDQQELDDNLRLFALLKLTNSLDFVIEERRVTLMWEIVLADTITGECQSKLGLVINNHLTSQLFVELVNDLGILAAFDLIHDQISSGKSL